MYLILFTIFLAVNYSGGEQSYAVSKEKLQSLKPTIQKCLKETGTKATALLSIKSIDNINENKEIKPFALCVLKGIDLIQPEGSFNIDQALSFFPNEVDKESLKKTMVECNTEKGKEPLDTTLQIYKCYLKKSPIRLSLPTSL